MSNINKYDLSGQSDHKYVRKVSNLERVYFWTPYSNVSLVTKIKGNIDKEKLFSALNAVVKKHPLIGAKIIWDDDNNARFSTDNVPKPNFKVFDRVSDTQWLEELQREITIPFDLEKGPLIRFILIYSKNVAELVVICNHSICDGMAMVYLVRDLLIHYENPKKEIEILYPQNMMDFLPKKSFSISSLFMRLFIHNANRRWKKKPYNFTQKDSLALQRAYWNKNQFNTVLLELEPSETKELLEKCRKNGVTIGSAITAAFIAAREELDGPFVGNQKKIWIPFDLRRHLNSKIGDIFCLFVGAPIFSYTYNSKKSFWDNVSVLHNKIHKRVAKLDSGALEVQDFDPTLLDALSSFAPFEKIVPEAYTQTENLLKFSKDKKNIAFSFAKKSENMVPGTIPSNLGRLNIPENYGDLTIQRLVFLPVISNSVPLTLGGLGIGNRVVFSLIFSEPKSGDGHKTKKMIEIRNLALKYLGFPENANGES